MKPLGEECERNQGDSLLCLRTSISWTPLKARLFISRLMTEADDRLAASVPLHMRALPMVSPRATRLGFLTAWWPSSKDKHPIKRSQMAALLFLWPNFRSCTISPVPHCNGLEVSQWDARNGRRTVEWDCTFCWEQLRDLQACYKVIAEWINHGKTDHPESWPSPLFSGSSPPMNA